MRLAGFSDEDWTRLGRAVFAARVQAGFGDTRTWCEKTGRGKRMLLGLERGEHVGGGTLDRVERALGWPPQQGYKILASADAMHGLPNQSNAPSSSESRLATELMRLITTQQGGTVADIGEGLSIAEVRDADTVAQALRSLAEGRPDATAIVTARLLQWSGDLAAMIEADTEVQTTKSAEVHEAQH